MIKAIVFDYGGVIKIDESDLFGEICNYLKIKRDDWEKEYFSVYYSCNNENKNFEEITLDIVSRFNNSKEAKSGVLNLLKNSEGNWHLNNEIIKIIKDLKNKNYKIALLSNNSIELKQRLKQQNIFDLFDVVVISGEVGYQKPQPEIFEILFSKLKVKPEEVVFTDDTERSLEGASDIGYTPILFTGNDQFKIDLNKTLNSPLGPA